MKIMINEKEFEIDDSTELNISFVGNLEKLSVIEEQSLIRQKAGVYIESGNVINSFINHGILINIKGNVNHAEIENGAISIVGEAKNIKTYNGSVKTTGNVVGNIETYNGSVKASGNVGGNIKTHNGSIKTGI